jgi:hypothetical protein
MESESAGSFFFSRADKTRQWGCVMVSWSYRARQWQDSLIISRSIKARPDLTERGSAKIVWNLADLAIRGFVHMCDGQLIYQSEAVLISWSNKARLGSIWVMVCWSYRAKQCLYSVDVSCSNKARPRSICVMVSWSERGSAKGVWKLADNKESPHLCYDQLIFQSEAVSK